jgi:uncharacterized YigZ family protein
MRTEDSFLTIRDKSEGLFRDRGSKFLAYAYPVKNEEEVKQLLMLLRREHPAARHHCYAWRTGPFNEAVRANDDGEPSNSAGKPILAQLQANELFNVLIVVVRYFGGTLLGVNGLINAYRSAAAAAISNAAIIRHYILQEYRAVFDAEDLGAVMRLLKENDAKILANNYEEQHEVIFRVKKQSAKATEEKFAGLYRVRLVMTATI